MATLLTKSALGFMMIISLAACSTAPRQIQITSKPIERPELVLPSVDPVNMRRVEWIVINEENMEAQLTELKKNGAPLAMFVLTAQGYENLGLNFSDIRAMVQQQQRIILAYENYYKKANQALDDAEKQRQEEAARSSAAAATANESTLDKLNPFKR